MLSYIPEERRSQDSLWLPNDRSFP